ncbi:MAG: hypothetical protein AAF298_09975 [Cyanobacteria bacterium P01_A01_bin.40]
MSQGWFVTASDIKQWTESNKRQAEELLPMIVRKLILASCKPKHLDFPSGDSIAVGGWDGKLEVDEGNEFIQPGKSVWEFGTNSRVKTKADSDYQKRTDEPGEVTPSETTFVFVTSRVWTKKNNWCREKNQEGIWNQVKGINADDLESWIQQCPGVHRWFAKLIDKRIDSIWDIEQAWESWIHGTAITATDTLVLNGRTEQSEELLQLLRSNPSIVQIKASSEQESYAFCLATLRQDNISASKMLIVKDQKQWDILLDTQNTLILIPQEFTPTNIGYAKEKGHFVVLPVDSNAPKRSYQEIQLEKMSKDDKIDALKSMGLSKDIAEEIYNDTRGYLGPIRRHKTLQPQEYILPQWLDKFDSTILIAVLMATQWDSNKEKDKEVLSKLADLPYNQLEEKLLQLASITESPVRLVGNTWQVISKIDLWSLIAHQINKRSIERLDSVVVDVLSESDPSYELAPKNRFMANIKGAIPDYSWVLKSGLADTMTLLAVFGDSTCQNLGQIRLENRIDSWVRKILNADISARGWYSLRGNVISLAEASPVCFLEALESSLKESEPYIGSLFEDEGEFGNCYHANLLWAIETVSWNPDYLARVTRILAKLSEIDRGTKYTNRPFNSLKEIYLGWINNTKTTHQQRLQIIDANLINSFPEVAWKLLSSLLLTTAGGISHPIHQPEYRDWVEGLKKEVTNHEYYQYVEGVADRLLDLANQEPNTRLPLLIEHITRLPNRTFYNLINKLLLLNLDVLDEDICLKIADKIRITISKQREFEDAPWALLKEAIHKLENVFNYILPNNPILINKHLFDNYIPILLNPISRIKTKFLERIEIAERYQIQGIVDIYQKTKIDGIKKLAIMCKCPDTVGRAIAKSNLSSSLKNKIFDWLESDEVNLVTVAKSFVATCIQIDKDWLRNTLPICDDWNQEKVINFLLALPFNRSTFEILNEVDEEVSKKYWKKIEDYILNDEDLEKINWVSEKLLINRRPLAAIDAMTQLLHRGRHQISLDCNLLSNILQQIAVAPVDKEQISISQVWHNILEAIEYIQNQEQLLKEEIARIEWLYLKLFGTQSFKPRYLEQEITDNPAFFAQLISWIFKSDNVEPEVEDIDKSSLVFRAENALELLNNISAIPGQKEDNSIDTKILKDWVYKARENLENLGRKNICDNQIGKFLSKSPSGTDGIWPHEAVREIIEELESPEFERALEIEAYNSRGVTIRSPFDGGKQEQELAKKYREQADAIKFQWPRTSDILRSLARSYEGDADWHNRKVELRE